MAQAAFTTPGGYTNSYSGQITGNGVVQYGLETRPFQRMTVTLDTNNPSSQMNVFKDGKPLLPEYAIFEVDGVRVGVIEAITDSTPTLVTRALTIFILFTSAYVAEIVRGGLQAVGRGQWEAAQALGLSPWKQTRLIVLPQALRAVIPGLVGQAISLFKDTTLAGAALSIVELLKVSEAITKQDDFLGQGYIYEALAFVSLLFWVGSYVMSRESQRLEKRLGVGQR
jgi:ABC-type amino acid transport system permease subunit